MNPERPLGTIALDRCLACGSRDLASLPLRYEFRDTRFPLVACRACGMRFLSVQPDTAALADLYGASYFERDFRCGRAAGSSFTEDEFRDENRGLLDAFEGLGPPGRLLEVGSAAGWLLKHARERGWEVQGVELSSEAVAHARGLGLDVFQGELNAAGLSASRFDLVYMGDVLEHVPDCRATLAEVSRVLRPGGHLYLRGPITTNSLARRLALGLFALAGRTIVLREPPYHLWEFTPASLVRLGRAVDLEVIMMRESKIPPGRAHGAKRSYERLVMSVIDAVNAPLTRLANRWGDRVVLVARKVGAAR